MRRPKESPSSLEGERTGGAQHVGARPAFASFLPQRPPHPPRRGTFSLRGRRGVRGGAAARVQMRAQGAPFSAGGRRAGGEGAQPVGGPAAVCEFAASAPPHPTRLRRPTFSHQGRREHKAALQQKLKGWPQEPPSPLVGEGTGMRGAQASVFIQSLRTGNLSAPLIRPGFAGPPSPARGEGECVAALRQEHKCFPKSPLLRWWEKGRG